MQALNLEHGANGVSILQRREGSGRVRNGLAGNTSRAVTGQSRLCKPMARNVG